MNIGKIKMVAGVAVQGLKTNRGRTMLTTLGIVIGISTVVVVLSAGRGLENYIMDQIAAFGANSVQIEFKIPNVSDAEMASAFVGGAEVTTLKIADFEALKNMENVDNYYAALMGQYTSSYKNNTNRSQIFAVSASLIEIDRELKMTEGRFFTDREDKAQAKVVVLGPEVKEDLFGDEDAVGKNIKINRVNFKVIGVTEPRGSYTYLNFDKMIYMPIVTTQKQMMGIDHVMFGFLTLNDSSKTEESVAEMKSIMRRRHGLPPNDPDKDDFRVTSMQEAMETVGTITSAMTLLVLVIAGISLVVGGVGIMNVMYLSVVERTREIGLRKAIGASNELIKTQFLFEAIIITGLGGVIGVIFGGVLVVLIDTIARTKGYDFGMTITWDAVLTALLAAIVFGLLFGLYPARKAAGLSPVEALRYE